MDVSTQERTTQENNVKYTYTYLLKRGKTRLTDYGKVISYDVG